MAESELQITHLTTIIEPAILILQSRLCKLEVSIIQTRIRELRKAKDLSQEQLALAVGTTRQTITSIEVGKYTASLALAYKIAHYFGRSIEEVFDFSDIDTERTEPNGSL